MAIFVSAREGASSHDRVLEVKGNSREVRETKTMEYEVIASSMDEPTSSVMGAFGLPMVGSISAGLVCKKLSVASYTPVFWNGSRTRKYSLTADFEQMESSDPTQLPPEVSWDAETLDVRCDKDVENGNDVENSAGEPLILTRPITVVVLNVSRYYKASDFPPAKIFEYTNTVSENGFWGAPAKTAKIEKISISYEEIENGRGGKTRYAKVTFCIKFKILPDVSEPWKASLLDFGNKCRDSSTYEIARAVDVQGRPIQVKLDGNGGMLPAGQSGVYLDFSVFEVKNFSPLHIDADDLGY